MNRNEKPLIFISNDDGFQARGFNTLIDALRPMGDIVAMAPATGQSGKACSVTFQSPVTMESVRREPGVEVYACTGTPVDCVKLAFQTVLPRRPALVVGGINHGDNSAVNVHYSGTMGVVLEGCMKGVPSIGYSLCSHDANADFAPSLPYVERITRQVLQRGLPQGVCLNVNFPDTPHIKGLKLCRQCPGSWQNEWAPHNHPRKGVYYWLTGEFVTGIDDDAYDRAALDHRYAAVTPIRLDMTDYGLLAEMEGWDLDL